MIDKTNTPDEVLDLVNENDEVIGETKKSEVHGNPLKFHREIAIILFDKDNKMFFQQRSFKKKVEPGLWVVACAGHIPKAILPEDAAHMELREELGFDTQLIFIEKKLDRTPTESRFVYWYIGKYNGEPITLEKEEVEATAIFSKDELEKMDTTSFHPGAIQWAQRLWSGEFDELIRQLG